MVILSGDFLHAKAFEALNESLGYGLIGVGVAAVGLGIMFGLNAIHSLPSSNRVEYLGSQNGYEAFVPNGQTINYNGHTDPVGDLILNNGKTIPRLMIIFTPCPPNLAKYL
jgi:hypothetical protein